MKQLVIITILLTSFLSTAEAAEGSITINKVFMHQPGDYSVMCLGDNSVVNAFRVRAFIYSWAEEAGHSSWVSGTKVDQVLIADVPSDQPMYMTYSGVDDTVRVEIHIHSIDNVSGGEWQTNVGKQIARGQTTVVE